MVQAVGHCLDQEEEVTGSGPGGNCDRDYRNHLESRHHLREGHPHSQQSLWRGRGRARALVRVTAVGRKAAAWSLRAGPPVSEERTDEHIWKTMGWKTVT